MAMREVPTYRDDCGNMVVFVKFASDYNMPGFTHRVIVNRTSVGFLKEGFKPSAKAADFFLQKLQEKVAVRKQA